jgi:hypothetical protein
VLTHQDGRIGQAQLTACRDAVIAGDELVAAVDRTDDQRDEQPAQRDRLREVDGRLTRLR